ncbi:hypothetical protein HanHA89_Chr09g0338231 [Helianthus annuus]|nr:hypothetical protein HanHA89_Chr09g0338231 [Helianthus annuus]
MKRIIWIQWKLVFQLNDYDICMVPWFDVIANEMLWYDMNLFNELMQLSGTDLIKSKLMINVFSCSKVWILLSWCICGARIMKIRNWKEYINDPNEEYIHKNYKGNVQNDFLAQEFCYLGLMTQNLCSSYGKTLVLDISNYDISFMNKSCVYMAKLLEVELVTCLISYALWQFIQSIAGILKLKRTVFRISVYAAFVLGGKSYFKIIIKEELAVMTENDIERIYKDGCEKQNKVLICGLLSTKVFEGERLSIRGRDVVRHVMVTIYGFYGTLLSQYGDNSTKVYPFIVKHEVEQGFGGQDFSFVFGTFD